MEIINYLLQVMGHVALFGLEMLDLSQATHIPNFKLV